VTALLYLMPAALLLGLLGLAAFLWALRSGQFEDLDGAAQRILIDEDPPGAPAATLGSAAGDPSPSESRTGARP
jgi:cbb3-type cytochrome oxidase maturation protein